MKLPRDGCRAQVHTAQLKNSFSLTAITRACGFSLSPFSSSCLLRSGLVNLTSVLSEFAACAQHLNGSKQNGGFVYTYKQTRSTRY